MEGPRTFRMKFCMSASSPNAKRLGAPKSEVETEKAEEIVPKEVEMEEEDPVEKKKESGLHQFARAMAKVKESTGNSLKNFKAAQDKEMKEAAKHRQDVFRKFPLEILLENPA